MQDTWLFVTSDDETVIEALASAWKGQDDLAALGDLSEPAIVPGMAGDTWYELACQLGIVAVPAGVFSSLIATWICNVTGKKRPVKVSITLRSKDNEAIAEIEGMTQAEAAQVIETLASRVYHQS